MKDATLAQGNQILNLILQMKLSASELQRLFESGLMADLLKIDPESVSRDEFRRAINFPYPTFPVEVDYDKPVKDLEKELGACGIYVSLSAGQLNPLGITGKATMTLRFVSFMEKAGLTIEEVGQELAIRSLRHAMLIEFLAFFLRDWHGLELDFGSRVYIPGTSEEGMLSITEVGTGSSWVNLFFSKGVRWYPNCIFPAVLKIA